jgi:hypothetical protein
LFRLGFMLCLRGEYADAVALAERIDALAQKAEDPALLIAACTIQGEVQFLRGHPVIARQWLERGLAASDSLADAEEGSFIADPRHIARHLGPAPAPRARRAARAPRGRAPVHVRSPDSEGVAIWSEGLVEVRLGNTERVRCWRTRWRDRRRVRVRAGSCGFEVDAWLGASAQR